MNKITSVWRVPFKGMSCGCIAFHVHHPESDFRPSPNVWALFPSRLVTCPRPATVSCCRGRDGHALPRVLVTGLCHGHWPVVCHGVKHTASSRSPAANTMLCFIRVDIVRELPCDCGLFPASDDLFIQVTIKFLHSVTSPTTFPKK